MRKKGTCEKMGASEAARRTVAFRRDLPVTRCAKHMLNGPCGGSREDRCEVRADRPCAGQLICRRLKSIGELDRLKTVKAPKNWSAAIHGGSRVVVREDHRI